VRRPLPCERRQPRSRPNWRTSSNGSRRQRARCGRSSLTATANASGTSTSWKAAQARFARVGSKVLGQLPLVEFATHSPERGLQGAAFEREREREREKEKERVFGFSNAHIFSVGARVARRALGRPLGGAERRRRRRRRRRANRGERRIGARVGRPGACGGERTRRRGPSGGGSPGRARPRAARGPARCPRGRHRHRRQGAQVVGRWEGGKSG
jgi:hypothetical protein